MQTVHAFKQF